MYATHTEMTSDPFAGPTLDTARWFHLSFPMPDDSGWVCEEPNAHTSIEDGAPTVHVERFENQHPAQTADNCKHVLMSTEAFPVPETGTVTISGDIAATNINSASHGYRDGFVSLIVIEPATGLVFDLAATSDGVFAIQERLPMSDTVPSPGSSTIRSPHWPPGQPPFIDAVSPSTRAPARFAGKSTARCSSTP